MRLILGLLLLFAHHASAFEYSDEPEVHQKILYVSYEALPKRLFRGEIFPVTFKTLSTMDHFDDIAYAFSGGRGVERVESAPRRRIDGRYFYDTFYFKATASKVRIPDVTATLVFGTMRQYPCELPGRSIDTVALNPQPGFANLVATRFALTNYKTTAYNQDENIVVFTADATRADLESFRLSGIEKQGFESVEQNATDASMTYYAVIPKRDEYLSFQYFKLPEERFEKVLIPIIVENDTVSTQSDLKPTEHRHTKIKIAVAGIVGALLLTLFIFRRKAMYLILMFFPVGYILFAAVPIRHVCVKEGSPIYLLPMNGGTVFELAKSNYTLEVQGGVSDFVKVKLHNNKIGWVKHEDLCTP